MNDKKIILASIGSGSTYLPDIANMIIERSEYMKVAEWRLMDIDSYRLGATGKYVTKMFADAGMETKITMTTSLQEAVTDCDFVLVTIRPGMSKARTLDETIPFKYGLIGQETTAPGGMLMGFKTIPAILEIAYAMEKYSKKNAWLINLANPSGMVSEALNRYSNVNFAGLCNGPTVIRTAMSTIYADEDPKDVFVQVSGLNHLIFCKVFVKGEDVTNEAFLKLLDWAEVNLPALRKEFVEPKLQQFIGYIPMGPYNEFYYDFPNSYKDLQDYSGNHWEMMLNHVRKNVGPVLDDLKMPEHATRAECVEAVEKRTFELYDACDPNGFKLAVNTRGGFGYGKAGISLMNAIWNNTGEIMTPDVRSKGCLPGLDADCVCSATSIVDGAGVHPIIFDPLPRHIMSFIQSAKQYEILAAEAAVTGSYHAALEALMANPLINSWYNAKDCLNEMLVAEKEWLPTFQEAISKLEKGEEPKN